MSEERLGVKVNIFGNEYTIRGEAKEDYIQTLARYVDEKMKEVSQGAQLNSPLKISILAAINLVDEIFRLRMHLSDAPAASLSQESSSPSPLPGSSIAPEAISALSAHIDAALKEK
jgi:cell division protein ZapA